MSAGVEDGERIELAAAGWAVRSHDAAFGEADMLALALWLEESPLHGVAYDRAMELWCRLDGLKTAEVICLQPRRAADPMRRPVRRWMAAGVVAAALAVATVTVGAFFWPAPAVTYETARGEQRTVALSDGSVMTLNTGTRVSVRLGRGARDVTLERGEVALKVVHDEHRPLRLTAGGSRVTDLGTEFDVLRDEDVVRVAVREGEVEMDGTRLRAGQTAFSRGGAEASLGKAPAEEAFAWQTRHAIYRDQPLSAVARDLNRYFDTPLIVDETSGRLRLTAVLTLDSEASVVGRLQEFLPLEARATEKGVYLTRAADGRRGAQR